MTSLSIKILIVFLLLIAALVILVRKGKMPVKYSLIWFFTSIVMIIGACSPSIVEFFRKLLGFELVSNAILSVFLGLVILITIFLTVVVSGQSKKINMLIQEISILKKQVEDKDSKSNADESTSVDKN